MEKENTHPYLRRLQDNLGRTVGLNEEQLCSQEQGIRVGFRAEIEQRLPPSDDAAMKRLIRRYPKPKTTTIKIERKK